MTEAELAAATQCAQDMLFVMRVMESIGLKVHKPMILEVDNKGAKDLTHNWSVGGRTRHVNVREWFLRDLKEEGVKVNNASQEVRREKKTCIHCGACTAVCPTGALYVKRPEMEVIFEQTKCSICEMCVPACPTRAMEVRPTSETFFE